MRKLPTISFLFPMITPGGGRIVGTIATASSGKGVFGRFKKAIWVGGSEAYGIKGSASSKSSLCGGAGSFLISKALAAEADVFITADMKYHEFFDADGRMLICDIGHYESEQFTIRPSD